ncbi:3-ketoacyl- reductase [Colletotrichum incanum]|uniref:3-ketoacyl-reductase n=1 Tax=Colletotrichum incanum TaxID=1573173 RepID=A0A166ZK99_COLIC|nr:3-ketoacyl- reductase [Colletotrichum incanum]
MTPLDPQNRTALWLYILAAVGMITILVFLLRFIDFIRFHFVSASQPLASYKLIGSKPTFALVTGASAGIGYGIAQALVNHGFGVILLGHREEELKESAAKLALLREDAQVRTIVMDACTVTPTDMKTAVETFVKSEQICITILVNNVGSNPIRHPPFRELATYYSEDIDAVINTNSRFMAHLTSVMLPILSRPNEGDTHSPDSTRRRSLILNIGSGGMIGSPWLVVYSATKAFNWSFSISLARELAAEESTRHVDSLCVVPGDVLSQGNSVWVTKWSPDSERFGRLVVEKADGALARGWREVRPFWLHDLQYYLLHAISESRRARAVTDVLRRKKDAFNAIHRKEK